MEDKQFEYTNRNRQKILFEYTSPTTVSVLSNVSQIGKNKEGEIEFIDFDGGPLLFKYMDFNDVIYNGQLQPFLDDSFRRIIQSITKDLLGLTITFKKIEKVNKTKDK